MLSINYKIAKIEVVFGLKNVDSIQNFEKEIRYCSKQLSGEIRKKVSKKEGIIQEFQILSSGVQISVNKQVIKLSVTPKIEIKDSFESCKDMIRFIVEGPLKNLALDSEHSQWCGSIWVLQFPRNFKGESALKSIEPLFERLIFFNRNQSPLTSFDLKFGIKENDFFKTFGISGYETRKVTLPPGTKSGEESITVNLQSLPILESGLQVSIDVNNKAKVKNKQRSDFKELLNEIKRTFENLNRNEVQEWMSPEM